jgi:hypothetical protein
VSPDQVVARHSLSADELNTAETSLAAEQNDFESVAQEPKHSPKNDWL